MAHTVGVSSRRSGFVVLTAEPRERHAPSLRIQCARGCHALWFNVAGRPIPMAKWQTRLSWLLNGCPWLTGISSARSCRLRMLLTAGESGSCTPLDLTLPSLPDGT
jgi:hypothetical protein